MNTSSSWSKPALVVAVLILGSWTIPAAAEHQPNTDAAAVTSTVAGFHQAIAKGDTAAAIRALDSDAIVLESGEMESRDEYIAHHLQADIAFAKAVQSTRTVNRVTVAGDAAWLVATSMASGTFEGRAIRSEGRELMVLRRTPAGWRIAAIHWSSHRPKAS